jgi:modulator of FtsH protease HflC
MRRRHWLPMLGALVAAGLLWRCFVTVDETEFVLVTAFGKPLATLTEAGLHGKWPHRSVIRFDRRLRIYDPKPSEFLTSDPKNILLDVYVCWRIRDPLLFLQRVTDPAGAELRLHDIVWAETAAEIGRRPLSDLVTIEAEELKLPEIVAAVRERCAARLEDTCGIELVDIRVKRLTLPEQNKRSVFSRMRAERDRIARLYRAEGDEEAQKIRADADRQRAELLAAARADAERLRGKAEQETIGIYANAHGTETEFYRFLRSLEAYERILGERTTLVLATDSDLFRYLKQPGPPAAAGSAENEGPKR